MRLGHIILAYSSDGREMIASFVYKPRKKRINRLTAVEINIHGHVNRVAIHPALSAWREEGDGRFCYSLTIRHDTKTYA